MAFTRPTLSQIIERIKGDFKSGLSLTTILRRSFLDVMAKAYAAAVHTIHGAIQNAIVKKFFPIDGDAATVTRWGTMFKLPKKEATFAKLLLTVTGTTGGTVVEDTIYVRADGRKYAVEADVVVPPSGTAEVTIVAQDAGADGNMDDGDEISLQSAQAGIQTVAVVDSTVIEAEDEEELEAYRARVLERMAFPPSGGTVFDYIGYAKSVAGVTRAWVLPNNMGQGTVGVTFVEDGQSPSIIPAPAKVQEVYDAIVVKQPINVDLNVFAPNELSLNLTIKISPNTQAVRDAITAELEDLVAREAQVRDAVDPEQVGEGVQFTGKIPLSKINEAISIAEGENDHLLVTPTSDPQPPSGGLITLGTITFEPLV